MKELTDQLKGTTDENGNRVAPTAALLAGIGQTLFRSGTKATNEAPNVQGLARAYRDLPFKTDGEESPSRAN